MLEVRSYEGSPEELAKFVTSQWTASYGGRMEVPDWNADYFRWQLRMDEPDWRRHVIAAYDGAQLAGVVPHFPMQFSLNGESFSASQASWLSVAPEFRGQGVARKLIQGSRAVHRELKLRFQVGFAYYGHQSSQGPKLWLQSQATTTAVIRKAGFWVRVLDSQQAAKWNLSAFQRWVTKLAAPVSRIPRICARPNLLIRPAAEGDLPGCLLLAEKSTRHCGLRLIWDSGSLNRQLGLSGFSQAFVAEEDGELRGCITFHILSVTGRTKMPVGILDLVFVSELSRPARIELLNSVLLSLKEQGAIVALKLRVGDYPRSLFMGLDWLFRPSDSYVLVTWAGEPELLPRLRRIHVLWR